MGDLSPNFNRSEFACRGCTPDAPCRTAPTDTVDAKLLAVLERVREHFGAAVIVTSGHRCVYHNRRVGGARASQHLSGRAADIVVTGVPPRDVFDYLTTFHFGGLGLYVSDGFVHVDTRDRLVRWEVK